MLLDLNLTTWARRMAATWFGARGLKTQKRRVSRMSRVLEHLEQREMLTTYTVTTLQDIINAGDGVISLREAIISANANSGQDTIQFAQNLNGTINLTQGQLDVTDSLTIVGNGSANTTINAQGNSRVFELLGESRHFEFFGLTITGGNAEVGGGIFNNGGGNMEMLLSDVVVSNSMAQVAGAGIYIGPHVNLTLENSIVTGNHTTDPGIEGGAGAGIFGYNGGTLNLIDSEVSGNETYAEYSKGAGIYWWSGDVTLESSTVGYNITHDVHSGGAGIALESGYLFLYRSSITGNLTWHENSDGGAINLGEETYLYAYDSDFQENRTRWNYSDGGAIYGKNATVEISSSRFIGNQVVIYPGGIGAGGGAIAMEGGSLTIDGSRFRDNTVEPEDVSDIIGVTLLSGGAIQLTANATATIRGSSLLQNSAYYAGGAIYADSGLLTIINSTIAQNEAQYVGGAIAGFNAEFIIDSSTIVLNSATDAFGSGGGVDLAIGSAQIYNSIIAQNTAVTGPDLYRTIILAGPLPSGGQPASPYPPPTVRNSLIGDGSGSQLTASATPDANLIGTSAAPIDPLLGNLVSVAGSPQVYPLQNGSPAINGGSNARADALGLTVDQTGRERFVGSAIDMGAFELQGPRISSIILKSGEPNPTFASSVSFTVEFPVAVSGVTASQFSALVTGSVQTGNITVTPTNNRIYTVTVNGVAGVGTLGLHFQSNGTITANATGLPMSASVSLAGTDLFTIIESPTLSVQSINYGPNQESPTIATAVTFAVTFSAPVTGVQFGQFTPVLTGTAHYEGLQLSGSGANYIVTVSGITGNGTLGLNFLNNGNVTRISDGLAMTTPTFTGAVYEIVQANQGVSTLDVGGLRFQAVGGGTFTTAEALNSFTGQVQVGFIPTGGGNFTPLAELNGTISVNTSTLRFSASGAVNATIGGTTRTLFNGGLSNISITELIAGRIAQGNASNLTVAGVSFALTSFGFKSGSQPSISLQGSLTLPKGIAIGVTGNNSVEINSSGIHLNGASFSLSNSFSVAGVTFSTNQLTATYNATGNVFSLTGSAAVTVTDIGTLNVNFSGNGLVINNGVFSSLEATVNGQFNVKGVKVAATNLLFRYTESNQQFSMSGTASIEIGGLESNLSVTFGSGGSSGIVITNGQLTSLDMTVNGQIRVAGVNISAQNVRLTYTANAFTLTGTASVAITGLGTLSLEFGDGAVPGMVVNNGSLQRLDLTVNANFSVGGVSVFADDLRFSYVALTSTFTMTGTAGMSVSGITSGRSDNSLSVTFGHGNQPGIVISNGALQRLDVTVNAEFEVQAVSFKADDLRFTYTAGNSVFTLSGTASVQVDRIAGTGEGQRFAVTFGQNGQPGIVVESGVLKYLDMTINASFEVQKVVITAEFLRFTYEAATQSSPSRFTMSGTASVKVNGIEGTGQNQSFAVTLGYNGEPGIEIVGGELTRLDLTINATFQVAKVTIFANNLRFTYTANSDTFTLSGTAGVNVGNLGANLSVTFGYTDANNVQQPGLVITNGILEQLDMTINAGFRVSAVQVNVQNVRFTYTRSNNTFTLSGGVTISAVGLSDLGNISATLGDGNNPGIVITNGQLVSLNFRITAGIRVSGLSVSGSLGVNYTRATDTIVISGSARIAVAGVGELNVKLGDPATGTQGLVIVSGRITRFDMTITTNINLAGLTLNGQLILNYTSATSTFTATGSVSLNIGSIGHVTANLGGNGTRGLVITNGSLTNLDMSVVANFSVGPMSLNGSLTMSYARSNNSFVMYGNANASLLGQSLISVYLGNSSNPGIQVSNGSLQRLSVTLTGSFTVLGVRLGSVSFSALYDSYHQRYYFSGTAAVVLPDSVPEWLVSILGGRTLASLNVVLDVYANNNSASYVSGLATIGGLDFGIRFFFDGRLEFIGNPVLTFLPNLGVTIYEGIKEVGNAIADWWNSLWGPLDGATIYYDPNFNFDFANDPSSTSGPDGRFVPVIPEGATAGQLVVVGGTDRSTGLVNPLWLTAPYDARVVSPLTTLINQLMQRQGLTAGEAMMWVNQALGIPTSTYLLSQSLIHEATGGDAVAARSFSREVALGTAVHEVASLLSGRPGAPSIPELGTNVFIVIAELLDETGGAPLDLSDPDLVREIINRTASSAGIAIDSSTVSTAATVIAGVTQRIDDLEIDNGTLPYLNRLLQIQKVAQGSIAPDLARLAAGEISLAAFANNYTGDALTNRFNAATYGELNVIGPVIAITPIISQAVGVGQPETFEYQVYLSSPTPLTEAVTVNYATRAQQGTTADVDFQQTVGTLTWLPGDTAPKTISIPVFATNSNSGERVFTVELSDPENAELVSLAAIGHIESSYFATTTAVTSSDTTADFGQELTFTALVTSHDPSQTILNEGSVSFFSGEELLGSAAVEAGVAVFITDTLAGGTHNIRAVYSGLVLVSERYLPSESAELVQAVARSSQSITFPVVDDVDYSIVPVVLAAFSTSGLPISYRVVSGPASLNGEVLTLTGTGNVVVEAKQIGDENYAGATPVTRSFSSLQDGEIEDNVAPVAQDGNFEILEGTLYSGQLIATDTDSETITYAVGLEPEHGSVTVNEDGTFEYTPGEGFFGEDSFTFYANDGLLISNYGTISITVLQENVAPVVTPATLNLLENSTSGTQVGTVTATDSNVDQTLSYSITGGNVDGAFAINPQTGVITIANPDVIDFELVPVFTLTIQVSDNGDPALSGTATVTIALTDEFEQPVLDGGSDTVTYLGKTSPITLMPELTVESGAGTAALGQLVISVFVQKKGSLADYQFGNLNSLGSVATSGQTDFKKSGGTYTVTITLNGGVTDTQVANFLRNITFSTNKFDKPKKSLGRVIEVQAFDRAGAGTPSNKVVTEIVANKKAPKVRQSKMRVK